MALGLINKMLPAVPLVTVPPIAIIAAGRFAHDAVVPLVVKNFPELPTCVGSNVSADGRLIFSRAPVVGSACRNIFAVSYAPAGN